MGARRPPICAVPKARTSLGKSWKAGRPTSARLDLGHRPVEHFVLHVTIDGTEELDPLGLILRHHALADLPVDLAPAAGLSDADRSLVLVMSRVLAPGHLDAYAELLRSAPHDPTDGEFDALPPDAGEDVRQDLAERMAPHVRRISAERPELVDPPARAPDGVSSATRIAASVSSRDSSRSR